MGKKDPRIDAYIARKPEFARPILKHLRAVVHSACPDVEETLKWGMPAFTYHGLLCNMAAFKQHAAFGFWKSKLLIEQSGASAKEAMGNFGRLTTVSDLPPKATLARYVKKAMALNAEGVTVKRAPSKRAALPMPKAFAAALAKNKKAKATFDAFPPGKRRDYIEWVSEAKGEDTRARRIATSVEWLAAGKARNWKYEKC